MKSVTRTLRLYLAVAAIAGVLAVIPATASADHYTSIVPFAGDGSCQSGGWACKADNRTHTIYAGYLGSRYNAATFKTLFGSYNTTDLNVQYMSSPTSNTDVIYRYGNLPSSTLGQATCTRAIDNLTCNQFIVTFDSDEACGGGCSDNFLHAIACHETGHTVGLVHGNDARPPVSNRAGSLACMQTPIYWWAPQTLVGAHNANQINFTY